MMVDTLAPGNDEIVVELGPGTGVFTRQLIAYGVKPENLLLVELDRNFAQYLRGQFAGVTVVEDSAGNLAKILARLGRGPVRKIVSGLPLRSMSPKTRADIARAVSTSLQPGGTLTQFSYFHLPPLPDRECEIEGLRGRRCGLVLSNLPPAVVWRYTKTGRLLDTRTEPPS